MLPDVEEINQTLRSSSDRQEVRSVQADLDEDDDPSGGFGRGFFLVLVIFAIAAGLYVFAPQVADALPQLQAPLDTYVSMIDTVRTWLNAQVASLMEMVTGGAADVPTAEQPAQGDGDATQAAPATDGSGS